MPDVDEASWWQAAEAVDDLFLRGHAAFGGQLTPGFNAEAGTVAPAVRIAPVRNLITLALFEAAARQGDSNAAAAVLDAVPLAAIADLLQPENARALITGQQLPQHIYPEERVELLDGIHDIGNGLYRRWASMAALLLADHLGAGTVPGSPVHDANDVLRFGTARAALTASAYAVPDRSVGYGGRDVPGDTRSLKQREDDACRRRVRRAVLRWRAGDMARIDRSGVRRADRSAAADVERADIHRDA